MFLTALVMLHRQLNKQESILSLLVIDDCRKYIRRTFSPWYSFFTPWSFLLTSPALSQLSSLKPEYYHRPWWGFRPNDCEPSISTWLSSFWRKVLCQPSPSLDGFEGRRELEWDLYSAIAQARYHKGQIRVLGSPTCFKIFGIYLRHARSIGSQGLMVVWSQ